VGVGILCSRLVGCWWREERIWFGVWFLSDLWRSCMRSCCCCRRLGLPVALIICRCEAWRNRRALSWSELWILWEELGLCECVRAGDETHLSLFFLCSYATAIVKSRKALENRFFCSVNCVLLELLHLAADFIDQLQLAGEVFGWLQRLSNIMRLEVHRGACRSSSS